MLRKRISHLGFILGEEQKLQKKILDYLDGIGCYTLKIVSANRRGASDIIVCHPTLGFIAIEVKAKGKLNNVTDLQQYHLDSVNRAGGIAFAADSLDLVKSTLHSIQDV